LVVYGPLRKLRLNRLWLGPKKFWIKLFFKMILIEIILPCAFDSNHTNTALCKVSI
jgi:hypothetical protein